MESLRPESPLFDAFYHGKRPGSETCIDFDEAATQTALDWLKENPKVRGAAGPAHISSFAVRGRRPVVQHVCAQRCGCQNPREPKRG